MNNNNNIYHDITNKLLDNLYNQVDGLWLSKQIKSLIENHHSFVQVLFNCEVSSVCKIINHFFDSRRKWDSQRASVLARKIINHNSEHYKKLSLKIFIRAGLSIELAIMALEVAHGKWQRTNAKLEPFEEIFDLNRQLRENQDNSRSNESEKQHTTCSNIGLKLSLNAVTKHKNGKKRQP